MIVKMEDIYYGMLCWYHGNVEIREELKKQIRKSSVYLYQLMMDINESCAISVDPAKGEKYNIEKENLFYLSHLLIGTLYSANYVKISEIDFEFARNVFSALNSGINQRQYEFAKRQVQKISLPLSETIEQIFDEKDLSFASRVCIYALAGVFIIAARKEAKKKCDKKTEPAVRLVPKPDNKQTAEIILLAERRKK